MKDEGFGSRGALHAITTVRGMHRDQQPQYPAAVRVARFSSRWGMAACLQLASGCVAEEIPVVPCGSTQACEEEAADAIVDDFSDNDTNILMRGGRSGFWWGTGDGTGTQMFEVAATPPGSLGASRAGPLLHTAGSDFSVWGANVGASLAYAFPDNQTLLYDASMYRGIRFRYALSGAVIFSANTSETTPVESGGDCLAECFGHFGLPLSPSAELRELEVTWGQLHQAFGGGATFDPATLVALQWSFPTNAPFELWLDDVSFLLPEGEPASSTQ